jgi:hypothetical protein
MKFFKHIMTTAVALGVLSVGAFANDQKHDQKPPKEPKVVERPEKQQPPPPRNENRGNQGDNRGGKDNRRGRP